MEPAACPSLTRGKFAYDFGDTAHLTPLTKMHTLGSTFTPLEPLRYQNDTLLSGSQNEAAGADALSSRFARDSVRLALIGNVANEYLALRSHDAEIAVSQNTVDSREETVRIVRARLDAGNASGLELAQAENSLASAQSQLSQLKQASSTTSYTARNEQFQAIAIIVILLLIIEACLNETKNSFFQRIKLFKR